MVDFKLHLFSMSSRKKNHSVQTNPQPVPQVPTKPNKKQSIITQIAQNPWYIFITFLVTLFGASGGISGVIAYKDYRNRKPEFYYNFNSWHLGTDKRRTGILLSGSILNAGEKPFYPKEFSLEIDYDGKKCYTVPQIIPKDFIWEADTSRYDFSNAYEKDFAKKETIQPGEIFYGLLLFVTVTPLEYLKFLKKQNFKIDML